MTAAMSMVLFINSKSALGIAGVTLAAAAIFAVVSGSDGTILSKSNQQQAAAPEPAPVQEAAAPPPAVAVPQPEIADFAPDEDLIDDTAGFDPSPKETIEIIEPETGDSSSPASGSRPQSGSTKKAAGQTPKNMAATAPKQKRSYTKGNKPSGIVSVEPRSPPNGANPIIVD